ncbi:MafI family immunity protein [Hymenobacter siberiensis]|uniref:MafI family immunity protein n=1 Tax=Hymenobacter siberiensis TaxID=2848396 RepID=UPI001C1E67E5|nr:MafI family immunity protein [Hymenobacter siberiensis]MBU6122911.1 MafI family immunity protein [Hymenobacter siberiensis]
MWHQLRKWLGPDKASVLVKQLLIEAGRLGLPARDAVIAQEYRDYAERGLAFEHMVTQLFEYAIPLTADFYEQVEVCAESLEMAPEAYSILLLLVKK